MSESDRGATVSVDWQSDWPTDDTTLDESSVGNLSMSSRERAPSPAPSNITIESQYTHSSFLLLKSVKVVFEVVEQDTVFEKPFAYVPDYASLRSFVRANIGSQVQIFMDGVLLGNANTSSLMSKAVEDNNAPPGEEICIILEILPRHPGRCPGLLAAHGPPAAPLEEPVAASVAVTDWPVDLVPEALVPAPTLVPQTPVAPIAVTIRKGRFPLLVPIVVAAVVAILVGVVFQWHGTHQLLKKTFANTKAELSQVRRERRDESSDMESAMQSVQGELDGCQRELHDAKQSSIDTLVSSQVVMRQLSEVRAQDADCRMRLADISSSYQECRLKVLHKKPPRVDLPGRFHVRAEASHALLSGSCLDEDGGFIASAEWVQLEGEQLELDGSKTQSVVRQAPAGVSRFDATVTIGKQQPGHYAFGLRCTDSVGQVKEGRAVVECRETKAPDIDVVGPATVQASEHAVIEVFCSAGTEQTSWAIKSRTSGLTVTNGVALPIPLFALPPDAYTIDITCVDGLVDMETTVHHSVRVYAFGALGIDLATTYSCAAYDDGNGPQTVFLKDNGDDDEDPCMPSCVAFHPDTCGILVGEPAKRLAEQHPGNAFCDIKNRLTGRRFSEQSVQHFIANVSWYTIVPKCRYQIPGDACDKPAVLVRCSGEERIVEPEQLTALLLDTMKSAAEAEAGHPLSTTVVSVPAAWNHYQRKATYDAAAVAGIRVSQLIGEPISAILHVYHRLLGQGVVLDNGTAVRKVNALVFDAGGGTTDISVIYVVVRTGRYEVIGTGGHPALGGADFDWKFAQCALVPKLEDKLGKALDLNDPSIRAALRHEAERAKVRLSDGGLEGEPVASVRFPFEGAVVKIAIRRAEFEPCVSDLIQQQMTLVRETLSASDLRLTDVQEVFLVGGQSQIPAVQRALRDLFTSDVLFYNEDPREAVVQGACRVASGHADAIRAARIRVAEVTPLQLGIEVAPASADEPPDGIDRLVPANSAIPTTLLTRNFTNSEETSIEVRVFEGPPDARRASDPRAHFLGAFHLDNLSRHSTIPVSFQLSRDGILTVTARSLSQKDVAAELSVSLLSRGGHLTEDETSNFATIHERFRQQSSAGTPRVADVQLLPKPLPSVGWIPPTVLTPEQVEMLAYQIPNAAASQLDLVILMDNTDSFGPMIKAAQDYIKEVVMAIQNSIGGAVVRVAVVGYRDHGEEYVVKTFQDFTANVTLVQAAVDGMRADGGGDQEEAVLEAYQRVLSLPFAERSSKLVMHVADAPPHGIEPDGGAAADILQQVRRAGGSTHGDAVFSLGWETGDDVDLHVIDPLGNEIFYGNKKAGGHGELDVDMCAGWNPCNYPGLSVENVAFARARPGRYRVKVHVYAYKTSSSGVGVPVRLSVRRRGCDDVVLKKQVTSKFWEPSAVTMPCTSKDPPVSDRGRSRTAESNEPRTDDLDAVLAKMSERGIKLFPVLVEPQVDKFVNARKFYVSAANRTSGQAVTLQNPKLLADFVAHAATVEVGNEHLRAEVKRMSREFDHLGSEWSVEARSEFIRRNIGGRGLLRRLIVDGQDLEGRVGEAVAIRERVGTTGAILSKEELLQLMSE